MSNRPTSALVPRIGITASRMTAADGRRVDAIPHGYADAVADAGGLPLLLARPRPELAETVVSTIDALLLTGGGDVGPDRYNCPAAPETAGVDAERDASETALVAAALSHTLPVLGICRGAQLLNVALGGSLHQHLAHHSELAHDEWDRRDQAVHQVRLAPGSLLQGLVGLATLKVNSVHHQGLDELGHGLEAVAWADDGLVEAVESPGRGLLAVQWHPELIMGEPGSRQLFAWLVDQARAASLNLT